MCVYVFALLFLFLGDIDGEIHSLGHKFRDLMRLAKVRCVVVAECFFFFFLERGSAGGQAAAGKLELSEAPPILTWALEPLHSRHVATSLGNAGNTSFPRVDEGPGR